MVPTTRSLEALRVLRAARSQAIQAVLEAALFVFLGPA